jgi:hypothetical protein
MNARLGLIWLCWFGLQSSAHAQVQPPAPGAGNAAAIALGGASPIVRSARAFLKSNAQRIRDAQLQRETLDAVDNSHTCVAHRAGVTDAVKTTRLQTLSTLGLLNPADDATFPGGLRAGIFPPVVDEGSSCPQLPQPLFSAPGSVFGGHHSYPGGLVVHESFNEQNDLNLADTYRMIYGNTRNDGLPEIDDHDHGPHGASNDDFFISQDIIIAAPLWHDWAKTIVFQWNSDGSEFPELNFGGNGSTDNYGTTGDSRTGAHHILGVAETMKRGLPPDFVITQACAHSAPTSGNEYKVVNWLRAAAVLADIDPVAKGYLRVDAQNHLRLPALRHDGDVDLNAAPGSPLNLLLEYTTHNLSDADFTLTGPAVSQAELFLKTLASSFGYDPSDAATYNNRYRNPALSYLTAERILVLYTQGGIAAIRRELTRLHKRGVL